MNDPLLLPVATLLAVWSLSVCVISYKTGALASPASLYSGLILIHVSIPAILLGIGVGPRFVNYVNEPHACTAVLFALFGLIALQAGMLMPNALHASSASLTSKSRTQWKDERVISAVIVMLIVGWLVRTYVVENGVYFQISRAALGEPGTAFYAAGPAYATIMWLEQLPLYGLCIVAIQYWSDGYAKASVLRRFLLVIVATELLYWLPAGRKEPVVLALVLPLIIRYLCTRRLPSYRSGLALLGFLVALFVATTQYRAAMEFIVGDDDPLHTISTAAALAETGSESAVVSYSDILLGRISLLEPISACIRLYQTNQWDAAFGATYVLAGLSLIPRLVWEDKPLFHYGTDFGHAAGMLDPADWQTSVSVSFFGEAFINFGWGGIVVLFVIGLIFGQIYRAARRSTHRETWLLLYVASLPVLMYIGGTFALYFGGLIKTLPFFYIVGRLMESRSLALKPFPAQLPKLPSAG